MYIVHVHDMSSVACFTCTAGFTTSRSHAESDMYNSLFPGSPLTEGGGCGRDDTMHSACVYKIILNMAAGGRGSAPVPDFRLFAYREKACDHTSS